MFPRYISGRWSKAKDRVTAVCPRPCGSWPLKDTPRRSPLRGSGSMWTIPQHSSKAEQALLRRLRDKASDGPVARYLNRPLSVRISRYLVHRDVTPNQISLFLVSVLPVGRRPVCAGRAILPCSWAASWPSSPPSSTVVTVRWHGSSTKAATSAAGSMRCWTVMPTPSCCSALTWHLLAEQTNGWILFVGFMAVIGSFMLSYTADKYDNLMRDRIRAGGKAGLRIGRDVRVFPHLSRVLRPIWCCRYWF